MSMTSGGTPVWARFGSYAELVRRVEDVLHERPGELIEVSHPPLTLDEGYSRFG
jgi:hypothetical protein